MAPKISVIMSVYNGEDYLAEAINSVINQTFTDFELIIINDCSKDGTASILKSFSDKDSRVKVHTNEVNLKLPASLNKAIDLAEGEYIARMDADDICLPNRLAQQYEFMQTHSDIALSSCRFMTLKNNVVASGGCGGKSDNESIKALLLITNPILHPGIIAKASVMKKLKYDTTLTCTEDLELWIRMAQNGYKMQILDQFLMLYRLHNKQITETTLERQHKEVVKIQKGYFDFLLEPMTEEKEHFYINGIYFKENIDVNKLCAFYRWAKKINNKKAMLVKSALDYAMLEILAEYKRYGIKKTQLLKAMLNFNPVFLVKELFDRKKRARTDGENCILSAKSIGYEFSGGSTQFPIFAKKETEVNL